MTIENKEEALVAALHLYITASDQNKDKLPELLATAESLASGLSNEVINRCKEKARILAGLAK